MLIAVCTLLSCGDAHAYYTQASTHLGVPGLTTQPAPPNIGQTYSSTSDTRSGSELVPNPVLGGETLYTLTASGSAYSNLATGMLGIFSQTSTSPGVPACCASVSSESEATLEDVLLFSNPSATATTVTSITAHFRVDGLVTNAPAGTLYVNAGLGDAIGNVPVEVIPGVPIMSGNFIETQPSVAGGVPFDQTFSITSTFTGPEAQGEIYLSLVSPAYGYDETNDFSHTGAVTLDLPAGVTFSSTSGVFLTQNVPPTQGIPEPGSSIVVVSGLVGLLAFRRMLPT